MFGIDDIARVGEGFATGGLSEFTKSNPFGVPSGLVLPMAATAAGVATGNPGAGLAAGASLYGAQQQAENVRAANAANIELAQEQMIFSAGQAQRQMDFQERMSSTSIRRAQADMLAAGINPMLAPLAQESTPSGAMGSYNRADVEPVPSVALNAMSSAKDLLSSLASVKSADANLISAQAQAKLAAVNARRAGVETSLSEKKLPLASVEERVYGWLNRFLGAGESDVKAVNQRGLKALHVTPEELQLR